MLRLEFFYNSRTKVQLWRTPAKYSTKLKSTAGGAKFILDQTQLCPLGKF
jgi:hypothetical protein